MKKPSILIVDDEPRLISSLSSLLGKKFNVFTAENGEAALNILNMNELSLVLLDLDMPVMNGLETLGHIRKNADNLNVIIMTGRSSHEWARKCADLGVQGYLEKPVETEELLERVNKFFNMKGMEVLKSLWGREFDSRFYNLGPSIKEALRYIDSKIDTVLSREIIASHLDITSEYLSTIFKKHCGIALNKYINLCKIDESARMLKENSTLKIRDIARKVGMPDVNQFCKIFKKETGKTPSQYRSSLLKGISINSG